MNAQLELQYGARYLTEEQWTAFLDLARPVIDEIGLKQMCWDVDAKATSISNALADRDRHAFHGQTLAEVDDA